MNNNFGNSWQVVFEPFTCVDTVFDEFAENFFEVVTVDYIGEEKCQYIGYLSYKPDEDKLRDAAMHWGIKLPDYECRFVPAQNWLTKNVIKFPPIETDDFLIYGWHESKQPMTNKLAIKIYAATAFGSGQHQTTRLCLKLLSYLNSNGFRATNVLDMGCGSGILALSSCKLWNNAVVLGADIDEEAVTVTLKNAVDNELEKRIHAIKSNGYENKQIKSGAPYQLIFANILARPLIEMAKDCVNSLSTGGYAILSGFIDEQVDWVRKEYESHGLKTIKIVNEENWHAILMEKTK